MGVPSSIPPPSPPLDAADFLARAKARLAPAPPSALGADDALAAAGDHVLNPGFMPQELALTARAAAVLVPVIAHQDGMTVLLTQRADHLRDHSGQVAFPGGKIDAGEDALAAALREAEEEIGLDRRSVEPLGYLGPYLTGSGFRILPVIGLLAPGFSLTLNPREVTDAFETPLAFLMDVANHQRRTRDWQGRQRAFYVMPYGDRNIWGVTAGIIRQLQERLYGP